MTERDCGLVGVWGSRRAGRGRAQRRWQNRAQEDGVRGRRRSGLESSRENCRLICGMHDV
jgi:hypothetical protein